jgi:hypothetical protein
MNIIERKSSWERQARAGVLVLAGICGALAVPHAWAHSLMGQSGSQNQGARVMSHLPLDESSFQDAIYRESGGHRYIYIQNAGSSAATIVDVTRRVKPKVTGTITLPGDAQLSNVSFQGDVIVVSSGAPATAAPAKEPSLGDVTIWDMTKPGAPKVVKQFNHVKKVISSPGGIDYVLDADGLWVVQTYSQQTRDWNNATSHIGP